jgi:hypothetical protein
MIGSARRSLRGLRSVPINRPIVRFSVPGNPTLRRGSRFFQLSATDPSVGESVPRGLALQITRSACHVAALKGVPTKFLCRSNHPRLPGPPQLRITETQPDGSAVEQENGRALEVPPAVPGLAAPPENERPRASAVVSQRQHLPSGCLPGLDPNEGWPPRRMRQEPTAGPCETGSPRPKAGTKDAFVFTMPSRRGETPVLTLHWSVVGLVLGP